MISGTGWVVAAVIMAAVAFIAFTAGILVRRGSDADLIAEQDAELDARQATIRLLSQELRRPAAVDADTLVLRAVPARLVERLGQAPAGAGYVTMPDWGGDQDLQLWVEAAGADLQRYVGALIAQAGRDAA